MAGCLQGKTVVVTRPQNQAQELCESVQAAGADVIRLPTLAIEPLLLTPQSKTIIMDLDRYEFVICVSPNAATLGLSELADYWPQWPAQQQWIAVGPATGAAMSDWQLNLAFAPQGSTSETLLDWPQLQSLTGKRVLILRGEGGRETLADTLKARGARVDYLELYKRVLPKPDTAVLTQALIGGESIILTVTSGDGLRNLMTLMKQHLARLQACPLLVVSGRLAQFAKEQGFSRIIEASSASSDDIVDALTQFSAEPE